MSLCRAESTRPGCRLGDWRGSPRGSAPVPSTVLSGGQLCDPVDGSPPGSSVYESLQAMILEWVTVSFSRRSSRPRDQTQVSCIAADSLLSELRHVAVPCMLLSGKFYLGQDGSVVAFIAPQLHA